MKYNHMYEILSSGEPNIDDTEDCDVTQLTHIMDIVKRKSSRSPVQLETQNPNS